MPSFPFFGKGGRAGNTIGFNHSASVGVAGVAIAGTATTSVKIVVPFGSLYLQGLSIAAGNPAGAASAGAVTAQVFRVRGGVSTALTAAKDITTAGLTATDTAIAFPFASGLSSNARQLAAGDVLRVDVVAAGSITTQPAGIVFGADYDRQT